RLKVPDGAKVVVDGQVTTSVGADRLYLTPPLVPGKRYGYSVKVTWRGKEVEREVVVGTGFVAVADFRPDFKEGVKGAAGEPGDKPPAPPEPAKDAPEYAKPGFVTLLEDGRLWVFKEGSKELKAFKKDGELAKHVTIFGGGPKGMTVKAPD